MSNENEPVEPAVEVPVEAPQAESETPETPEVAVDTETPERLEELSRNLDASHAEENLDESEADAEDPLDQPESDAADSAAKPEKPKNVSKSRWEKVKAVAGKGLAKLQIATEKGIEKLTPLLEKGGELFNQFKQKVARLGPQTLRMLAKVLSFLSAPAALTKWLETQAGTDSALLHEQAKKINLTIIESKDDEQYVTKLTQTYELLLKNGKLNSSQYTKAQFYEAVVKAVGTTSEGVTMEDLFKSVGKIEGPKPL